MKIALNREQMAELEALGVDTEKSSVFYDAFLHAYMTDMEDRPAPRLSHRGNYNAFVMQDLMNLLPWTIVIDGEPTYWLQVRKHSCGYFTAALGKVSRPLVSFDGKDEIIDALFELVKWNLKR